VPGIDRAIGHTTGSALKADDNGRHVTGRSSQRAVLRDRSPPRRLRGRRARWREPARV